MTSLMSYKGIYPSIGNNVYIAPTSILVGEIEIGDDSSIWPLVAARGDVNYIKIGRRTNIQDSSVLHVTHKNTDNPDGHPLIIGNDVTIGHKVMLHGCTIKDKVLVGMGSIVLDGAIIENEVLVGAGSLVPPNKVLQSGFLYIGSPVKQVRLLTDKELAYFTRSANNYVNTKNDYLAEHKEHTTQ